MKERDQEETRKNRRETKRRVRRKRRNRRRKKRRGRRQQLRHRQVRCQQLGSGRASPLASLWMEVRGRRVHDAPGLGTLISGNV